MTRLPRTTGTAFLDYTRAGALEYLVMVAEFDDRNEHIGAVCVARYGEAEKRDAEAHVRGLRDAIAVGGGR
jgi:hypothetical protein